jgi:hypothetical protein
MTSWGQRTWRLGVEDVPVATQIRNSRGFGTRAQRSDAAQLASNIVANVEEGSRNDSNK